MKIVVQFFEGCPHWRLATERVGEAVRQIGRDHQPVELQRIETHDEAAEVGFGCSPTILIASVDPFRDEAAPVVYAYLWSAGAGAG